MKAKPRKVVVGFEGQRRLHVGEHLIAAIRMVGDTSASQRIGRLTGLRDDLAHSKGVTAERAPSYLEYLKVFKTNLRQHLFEILRSTLLQAVAG